MLPSLITDGPFAVLCIAGFDPSGGAGLLADARACAAMRAHAVCVQTALVPQNTRGTSALEAITPEMVTLQAQTLLDDVKVSAIKVGLIPNRAVLNAVLEIVTPLVREQGVPLVVDPVLAPSHGATFTSDDDAQAIVEHLFPLASHVTPNTLEAAQLAAMPVENVADMERAARMLWERTRTCSVLVKGGHIAPIKAKRRLDQSHPEANSAPELVLDIFFDGKNMRELRSPRVEGTEVRGTGCLLASAIAAQLAHGVSAYDASRLAKSWLTKQIEGAQAFGGGRRIAAF